MNRRRRAAILVVTALALTATALHPCGVAQNAPRAAGNGAIATATVGPAPPNSTAHRRAKALEDAPISKSDGPPPAATTRASVVVQVVAVEARAPIAGPTEALECSTDGDFTTKADVAGAAWFVGPSSAREKSGCPTRTDDGRAASA